MEVPLQWRLSVLGAQDVKSQMSQLNAAFDRGVITSTQYAKSQASIAREAQRYNNAGRYQNQIFLAMHPNINKVSRSMSTFASIARTALSALTTLNTLFIANNTASSEGARLQAEYAENMRGMARSIPGSAEWQKFREGADIALASMKEMEEQKKAMDWEKWGIAAIGAIMGIDKIIKNLPGLDKFFGWFSGGLSGAMGGAAGGAIGGVFFKDIDTALRKLFPELDKFRTYVDGDLKQSLDNFFMVAIPTAIGTAGQFLTNFFLNDLPAWAESGWKYVSDIIVKTWNMIIGFIESGINSMIDGFVGFVNMIIDGINKIIDGLNKLPGVSIGRIGAFSLDHVKLGRIETEPVNNKTTNNTQGPSNTYITVEGSVITERELMGKVDSYLKSGLKSSVFK